MLLPKFLEYVFHQGNVSQTLAAARRRGLATGVCSFITAHILDRVRYATTSTMSHNAAMIRVAEKLGYRRA